MNELPRGLEVLLKKAAIDAAFRERLLAERARAAALIGLTLEPAEAAMLDAVPAKQLEATVAGTHVDATLRPVFMASVAAAMLATLAAGSCCPNRLGGARPDIPPAEVTKESKDAGAVEGVVQDDQGKPMPGASVNLAGTSYVATADDHGRFRLDGVPAGSYQINARSGGFMQLEPVEVTVTAGKTADVNLTVRYISPPGGARPDLP